MIIHLQEINSNDRLKVGFICHVQSFIFLQAGTNTANYVT